MYTVHRVISTYVNTGYFLGDTVYDGRKGKKNLTKSLWIVQRSILSLHVPKSLNDD